MVLNKEYGEKPQRFLPDYSPEHTYHPKSSPLPLSHRLTHQTKYLIPIIA